MEFGEKCIKRSCTICGPNFSINAVSDLSFIIYRPEREDIIKMRVKEKAYKDNDYIYREHDVTSGGICRHGDELQS